MPKYADSLWYWKLQMAGRASSHACMMLCMQMLNKPSHEVALIYFGTTGEFWHSTASQMPNEQILLVDQ